MIRIPLLIRGACRARRHIVGSSGGRRSRRISRRLRRRNRFVDEFDLIQANQDVVLTHAEEATHSDDNTRNFAGLIDDDLVDVAELLILLIVDIHADELRSAPLSVVTHGSGGGGWCWRTR